MTPSPERQEGRPENAREECHDRVRRLQRRGAFRDKGARRRAARRRQERRQEGRRPGGRSSTASRDGAEDRALAERVHVTVTSTAPSCRRRPGTECPPTRTRTAKSSSSSRTRVQLLVLDPGLPGPGEPRRRRHVAGGVRAHEVEPRGGEEGRRAGEVGDLLTVATPVAGVMLLACRGSTAQSHHPDPTCRAAAAERCLASLLRRPTAPTAVSVRYVACRWQVLRS